MLTRPSCYRRDYFIIAAFLLALLARTLFVLYYPHNPAPDEGAWRDAAVDLSSGKGFTNILRHPGYIAFLAAIYKISGGAGDRAALLTQAVLSALQVLLVFSLARSLFRRESIACLAALLLALYPYAIFQTGQLLCESFYSFLLTLFMPLLYLLQEQKYRTTFAAMAGLAFGLALLTKSTLLLVSPFILAWFAINRLPYRTAASFFLAAGLCVLPWSAHNYRTFGKFILVNMSGSYLFQANNRDTLRLERETRQLKDVQWYTPEYVAIAELPPIEADREYTARALNFMRRNPAEVLTLMKMRFVHFWRFYPITNSSIQKYAALLTSGLFIPLALLGMFLSRAEWKKTFLPWATIFAFNFAHLFFICTMRYRIPLDPFFIIFAAYAIVTLYERFTRAAEDRSPAPASL